MRNDGYRTFQCNRRYRHGPDRGFVDPFYDVLFFRWIEELFSYHIITTVVTSAHTRCLVAPGRSAASQRVLVAWYGWQTSCASNNHERLFYVNCDFGNNWLLRYRCILCENCYVLDIYCSSYDCNLNWVWKTWIAVIPNYRLWLLWALAVSYFRLSFLYPRWQGQSLIVWTH